jgi:glycosyltransferase involved in cell wall biosynthesis
MIRPKYSVVIPVYDRPLEMEELLESLAGQTFSNFEVIIIEDGSTILSKDVVEKYSNRLNIRYFYKPNSGPGPSRNFGFEKASGDYLVVFDSDCIIPPKYFQSVEKSLATTPLDAWGGPDRGSENFTPVQRAMAYTMSSVFTTGGIRGGKAAGFQPRSFNMGISREVFQKTNGFQFDRLAEDIELSMRVNQAGFRTGLITEAYVFHKRRTNFSQFFKQVSGFGRGRIRVGKVHPGAIKLVHWFPAVFLAGLIFLPMLVWSNVALALVVLSGYLLYLIAIGIDAAIRTRSVGVAILSIPAAVIQLTGYGSGFIGEMLKSTR